MSIMRRYAAIEESTLPLMPTITFNIVWGKKKGDRYIIRRAHYTFKISDCFRFGFSFFHTLFKRLRLLLSLLFHLHLKDKMEKLICLIRIEAF